MVHTCFFVAAQAYLLQRPSASYTTEWGRKGDPPHGSVPSALARTRNR